MTQIDFILSRYEEKCSHHSVAQMEMGILYVADIILPSWLD